VIAADFKLVTRAFSIAALDAILPAKILAALKKRSVRAARPGAKLVAVIERKWLLALDLKQKLHVLRVLARSLDISDERVDFEAPLGGIRFGGKANVEGWGTKTAGGGTVMVGPAIKVRAPGEPKPPGGSLGYIRVRKPTKRRTPAVGRKESRGRGQFPRDASELPARFAYVQAFEESDGGERADEIGAAEPLRVDHWYQFDVTIGVDAKGIKAPKGRKPFREPRLSVPADIVVIAESADCEIMNETSSFVLPVTGDVKVPATFRVRPQRRSLSKNDRLSVQFTLYYKLNLLEVITVRAETVPSATSVRSRRPKATPVTLQYDRARQADLGDIDLTSPASLHIRVRRADDGYHLTFTLASATKNIPLRGTVRVSEGDLESAVLDSRKNLFLIASSSSLALSVRGTAEEYDEHVRELSRSGRRLWTLLFDDGPAGAMTVIGRQLANNPLPPGAKIQVSIEGTPSSFVFAWGLLYDRPVDNTTLSADGFWGLRYVIEQRPMNALVRVASEAGDADMGAMYWRFDQAPEQQRFLVDLLKKTTKPCALTLSSGDPIDTAAKALECLQAGKSHVLYFFTHGHQAMRNAATYGVTAGDVVKMYDKLPADSRLRESWTTIVEDLKQSTTESDQSWIGLTYGRLELDTLYDPVPALPARPLVILNMCDSAQVTPSLSKSFVEFFLGRGARAVIGTECPMRPVFADFVGRGLLTGIVSGRPVGSTLLDIRRDAAEQKNLLGLAYTLFGAADAALPASS
jgi:hypothetical protein